MFRLLKILFFSAFLAGTFFWFRMNSDPITIYFFREEGSDPQIELETNSSQGSDSADPRKKSDRPNLYVVE